MPVEDLKQSPMMNHMLEALDRGEDIGHYGRLTFAMIARYFMENEELVQLLAKDRDFDEDGARALVHQVEERGYNPPRRRRSWSGRRSRISRSARLPTTLTPATSTMNSPSRTSSTRITRSIVRRRLKERSALGERLLRVNRDSAGQRGAAALLK